jgi:single-strand DNA-binding protein
MLNRVTIIGRLGSDAKNLKAKNGKEYTALSVATSNSYKDAKGQWQEKTEWHPVIAWWNLTAAKGQIVYVEGEMNYIADKDQKNAFITAKSVKVISNDQKGKKIEQSENTDHDNEDLPF